MAEKVITQGAIKSIFDPNGCEFEQPILQCVQIRAMEAKAGEGNSIPRYRVVVSDIKNFIQTMVATGINDIVQSGKLKKGCIIKLLKFNPQMVKDKKILILMDLEILEEYGELDKIGMPEALEIKDEKPQPSAISGSNFYGGKTEQVQQPQQTRQPPQQDQQKSLPHHQNRPSATHPHLYPIESLSPYAHKWTIRGRCTYKGEMKTWHNARGEGKLFSINLLDDTGEIRCTAFNDAADKLFDVFQEGTVYYVTAPCKVVPAKKQFSKLPFDYELNFERDTEVEKAEDQDNAPQIRYNFVKIASVETVEKDAIIDALGILKEVGDVTTITSKTTNKDFEKRELTIADDSQTSIRVTIWGNTAKSFEAPLESVLAFKGVKVSDFSGRSLSLLSSGSMTIEPDIEDAHKLRGWYDGVGNTVQFSTHQGLSTGAGNRKTDSKLISKVVKEEAYLQSETPTYFDLKASIVYVRPGTFAYPACQGPNCSKKVIEENPDEWWCEKCQKKWPKPNYRYILSANVADHTGMMWLSFFDEAGQTVMGMSANELVALKEADERKFSTAMQQATCKTYNFRVRGKMETFQDQPKPRYQVSSIHTLDYAKEALKLAELIKKFEIKSEKKNSLFVK